MANPTTNYGFVLPTSSDLVTDLPADFDVALQGVDTRLKALQPGTTLGDLAYSSATANTNTRLAIGSTGNVLTVSGGVPTWAAPAGGGKVLQVVQGTFATASTTTSATYADTGLTVNITPSAATSKVLIMVHHNGNKKNATGQYTAGKFKVLRGGTTLLDQAEISWQNADVITNMNWSWAYLDSPATTSATTYKTQYGARVNGESFTICVDGAGAPSTIIAMEIGV